MRGRGRGPTGLGNADSKWTLPSLPTTGAAQTPPPAASARNDRFDDYDMEVAKRPPPQYPDHSPFSEPASKMMTPTRPPPGFAPTRHTAVKIEASHHSPEDEVPPARRQPSFEFAIPAPVAQSQRSQLHHGDQAPIGGHDLVSLAPSLAGTSISSVSHLSQLNASADTSIPYNYLPKSELHSLYGQQGKLLSARYYHTWHDGGPAHGLRWTSALVCPISSEIYVSAPYAGASDVISANGSYWFMKKSHAEHAAAAIAYDCWMLRNNVVFPTRLSLATAYPQQRFELPATAPTTVRLAIEELQREWLRSQR